MKQFSGIIMLVLILSSCSNNKTDKEKAITDNYERGKINVAEIEAKTPARFLKATGGDKKNLLGQTVIRGAVENKAKIVTYKDVEVRLRFYSKTGVLLEEDHETIYDEIAPGDSKSFKTKYFAAKGSDSVAIDVVQAKVVE